MGTVAPRNTADFSKKARGKPGDEIEDLGILPSTATIALLPLFIRGRKLKGFSKGPAVSHRGGNNTSPPNRLADFPAFPFTALFIFNKFRCKKQSFSPFFAPGAGQHCPAAPVQSVARPQPPLEPKENQTPAKQLGVNKNEREITFPGVQQTR